MPQKTNQIIYGIEAVIVNITCLGLILLVNFFGLPRFVAFYIVITAILYSLYTIAIIFIPTAIDEA